MKNLTVTIYLIFAMIEGVVAQNYPTTSYQVNGQLLVKWLGTENNIDFTQDAVLKDINEIKNGAFANNTTLKSIKLPPSLQYVELYAFQNCSSLESVIFTPTTEDYYYGTSLYLYIESYAFENCTSLRSVSFPNYLKSTREGVFDGCTSLTSFSINSRHPYWRSYDGIVYSKNRDSLILFPPGITGSHTVHNQVRTIAKGAFENCLLSSIFLPNEITKIDDYAFRYAKKLKTINFPTSLQVIGSSAFARCDSLRTLILPVSLDSIKDYAFDRCYSLPIKVKLPDNVTYVNGSAFSGSYSVREFELSANNPYYSVEDGVLFSKHRDRLVTYPAGKSDTYTIPEGISIIGEYAFCFSKIKNITFPSSLREILDWSFSRCDSIKRLTIPNGVTKIGDGAFFRCSTLKYIELPASLTSLHSLSFYRYGNSVSRKVTCYAQSPVGAWSSAQVTSDTLYVPEESIELYKIAPGWKDFDTILPIPQQIIHRVTYSTSEGGIVIVTQNNSEINNGSTVADNTQITIEAVPYTDYRLASLSVNGIDTPSGSTITVNQDINILATFEVEENTGYINPTEDDALHINLVGDKLHLSAIVPYVSVYDMLGRKVAEATNSRIINLSYLHSGIYVVKAGGKTTRVIKP